MPDLIGYVTVEEVRQATGVLPADFKLTEDEELDQLLQRWIGYVAGEINDHCGRNFAADADQVLGDVPHAVRSVAERALSRWVNQVRSHRDSALIRLDEWRVAIDIVDEVLPRHLRDTLDRHMRSRRRLPLSGFVSHGGHR